MEDEDADVDMEEEEDADDVMEDEEDADDMEDKEDADMEDETSTEYVGHDDIQTASASPEDYIPTSDELSEYESMKLVELREILSAERCLKTGNKKELMIRLVRHKKWKNYTGYKHVRS